MLDKRASDDHDSMYSDDRKHRNRGSDMDTWNSNNESQMCADCEIITSAQMRLTSAVSSQLPLVLQLHETRVSPSGLRVGVT